MKRMYFSEKSLFISFEGIDGCGKSTQAKILSEELKNLGHNSIILREPGGSIISEKIRNILLHNHSKKISHKTEALLMTASRAQLVEEVIKVKLKQDIIVIADRYIDSTIAYQGGGRGLEIKTLHQLNNFATDNLIPDLTFLIDLEPMNALKRRGAGDLDRIEKIGNNFQEKVREQYLKLAHNNKRFILIDGEDSVENIHSMILNSVKTKLRDKKIEI